ncbi:TPA: hypothetical protein HA251_01410 [Candidatus Woesearchaeota archaeon]|nr:hypothetical protein [Candidatus Woesearchaeota archaeon]
MAVRFYVARSGGQFYLLMQNGFLQHRLWIMAPKTKQRYEVKAVSPHGVDASMFGFREARKIRSPRSLVGMRLYYSLDGHGEHERLCYTAVVEDVFDLTRDWHFLVKRLDEKRTFELLLALLREDVLPQQDLEAWRDHLLKNRYLVIVPPIKEVRAFLTEAFKHGDADAFIKDFLYNEFMNKPYLMERLDGDILAGCIDFADPSAVKVQKAA